MKFAKAWNKARIPHRCKLAHAAGLEGKRGGAAWAKPKKDDNPSSFLTEAEKEALTSTILELSARYQKRRAKIISKTAKTLGVSSDYLKGTGQKWLQEGRPPTEEEFQEWARNQHPKACKKYEPAWPLSGNNGRCVHCVHKKPCTSFFAHTGICETGYFEVDRITITKWSDFQKQYRKATRKVKKVLEEN